MEYKSYRHIKENKIFVKLNKVLYISSKENSVNENLQMEAWSYF